MLILPPTPGLESQKWRPVARYDGQYAARYTLNSCLVGVVIALPQKRSGESNGALVDNTKGLSCFGIT